MSRSERKGEHHAQAIGARAGALATDGRTLELTAKTLGVINDASRLRQIAAQRANLPAEVVQGWQFEQLEVVKFNLDALRKGSRLRAAATDGLGMTNHPSADVIIRKGKKQLKAFQLKSCEKPSANAFQLADPKYSSVDLVGPVEQHSTIQHLYKERSKTGALKAEDYKSAGRRLRKGVEADGISSGGTTRSESLAAATKDGARRAARRYSAKAMLSESHQAGLEGAKIGGTIAGGISAVTGLVRVARGEAEAGEILAHVTIEASKGYAVSYISSAVAKGSSHAVRAAGSAIGGDAFGHALAGRFVRSNAHVALASGIVEGGKSLVRYLRGEIDESELLSEISHTAMTGASSFYYGALGQVLIPVPVLGAFVGSTVGYFVGNMLHQSGLISLGETAAVRIARERKERVEALCLTAIPLMRAHRIELEELLNEHFSTRRRELVAAFDDLEGALVSWDGNHYLASLERVNIVFGSALPFRNQNDFDKMMLDSSQPFGL